MVPSYNENDGTLTLSLDRNNIFLDDVYECGVENDIGAGLPGKVTLNVRSKSDKPKQSISFDSFG